jgi:uncharacterized membrane protein YhaH (DUF805 family)
MVRQVKGHKKEALRPVTRLDVLSMRCSTHHIRTGEGLMGFGEAIRTCLRKYVDFNGRASRSEYWWFALFYFLVGAVARLLDMFIFQSPRTGGPVDIVVSLALLLPSLSVFVRRLHDLDRTGWWTLLFCVAIGGAMIPAAMGPMSGLFIVVFLGLCIWLLIWTMMKGTIGPNHFGLDPLASETTTTPSPAPVV